MNQHEVSLRRTAKVGRQRISRIDKSGEPTGKDRAAGQQVSGNRRATAYHEAGHAVMALVHQRGFRYVTITARADSLGHVLFRRFSKNFDPEGAFRYSDPRIDRTIDVTVDCALAGHIAEKRATGRNHWSGAIGDHDAAIELALYRCGSTEQAEAYLEWRRLWVRDKLTTGHIWKAVEAVAEALVESERLSHAEARAVYCGALAVPASANRSQ
jgi:hypothetical protein